MPQAAIYEHAAKYVGLPRQAKLKQVREAMEAAGCQVHLISSLDDIAWVLNLRGSDVEYNPVFLSHLILTAERAILCVEPSKLSEALKQSLAEDCVELLAYDAVEDCLAELMADDESNLLIDAVRTAWSICEPYTEQAVLALNPSQRLKASKNDKEIAHIRHAMEKDGAALCEFFAEFE